MAGFVPSPNCLRLLIHFSLHGRPQLSVFHLEYSLAGPLNPNIADTIYDAAVGGSLLPAYLAQAGTHLSINGVEVIDIRSADNPGIQSTGAPVAGTNPSNPSPDQVAIVVTLRTGKTGRSHRGRSYVAGWTSAAVAPDGTIAPAAQNAALSYVQAWALAASGVPAVLAIRSPALPDRPAHDGTTLPAKPFELTQVLSFDMRDTIFDTNRRRLDQLHR
jgi:hypothetical protein